MSFYLIKEINKDMLKLYLHLEKLFKFFWQCVSILICSKIILVVQFKAETRNYECVILDKAKVLGSPETKVACIYK